MGSWLFIPGNNKRALQKIDQLAATKIIIDLEDAVPKDAKHEARTVVANVLETVNRQCLVRINDFDSGLWKEDIACVFHQNLEGIVLPKAESSKDIIALGTYIESLEIQHQREQGAVKIYPLIESAKGVMNAWEIATAYPRVSRILFGAIDYSLDVNVTIGQDGHELLYPRTHLVLSSKVANISAPIDTVFIDIANEEGLKADTEAAKNLGFEGKMVIHPKQVSVVNHAFNPTEKEIKEAEELIAYFVENNFKAVQFDGKMIDKPVYEQALKVIERSKEL